MENEEKNENSERVTLFQILVFFYALTKGKKRLSFFLPVVSSRTKNRPPALILVLMGQCLSKQIAADGGNGGGDGEVGRR